MSKNQNITLQMTSATRNAAPLQTGEDGMQAGQMVRRTECNAVPTKEARKSKCLNGQKTSAARDAVLVVLGTKVPIH
jgi:hypothetical protein